MREIENCVVISCVIKCVCDIHLSLYPDSTALYRQTDKHTSTQAYIIYTMNHEVTLSLKTSATCHKPSGSASRAGETG